MRWSKGFLQVFRYYGPFLIRRAIQERDFSAVDLTILVCPLTVLAGVRFLFGVLFAAFGFVNWSSQINALVNGIVLGIAGLLAMMGLAALTVVTERNKIGASNKELFAYCLAFPIFMLSYVPISFQAIFSNPGWKPIEHRGK